MEALGGSNGWLWGWKWELRSRKPIHSSKSSDAVTGGGSGGRFPLKQAATAGSLALTGDTIAQLRGRWRNNGSSKQLPSPDSNDEDAGEKVILLPSFFWF